MNNTYGTVKPSVINPSTDVEIWYKFTPNRSDTAVEYTTFNKVTAEETSTMFTKAVINNSTLNDLEVKDDKLPGMYNLSLPASIFGAAGFYTVYIKPREIYCTIKDVGALAAYPDTRGIIIDVNTIDANFQSLFASDNLTGYRVEYFGPDINNSGNSVRQDYYRLITSGGLCEPVSQNLTSANTNSNGYRYNENGTLSFLSLSPNLAPSFKGSTQKPFIGNPSQQIVITNTKFDPVCIEIEICRNDFDTITNLLTGNQIRSLDNGLLTTYNSDGEIINQSEFYTVKDAYTTADRFDVKKNRVNNIDFTIDYEGIISQS